jgi:hypothetical protein
MMLMESDTPHHMIPFFLNEDFQLEEDDEIGKRLAEREPSETEPAIFLTKADKNAAMSWVFFQ